jgi:hypothetical protein
MKSDSENEDIGPDQKIKKVISGTPSCSGSFQIADLLTHQHQIRKERRSLEDPPLLSRRPLLNPHYGMEKPGKFCCPRKPPHQREGSSWDMS